MHEERMRVSARWERGESPPWTWLGQMVWGGGRVLNLPGAGRWRRSEGAEGSFDFAGRQGLLVAGRRALLNLLKHLLWDCISAYQARGRPLGLGFGGFRTHQGTPLGSQEMRSDGGDFSRPLKLARWHADATRRGHGYGTRDSKASLGGRVVGHLHGWRPQYRGRKVRWVLDGVAPALIHHHLSRDHDRNRTSTLFEGHI